MAFVIGFAAKGVAMGIGLASESIHAHKEKKEAKKLAQSRNFEAPEGNSHLTDESPADNSPELVTHHSLDKDRESYEGDEAHWQLDEVQDTIQPPSSNEGIEKEKKNRPERNIVVIIDAFILKYPTPPQGELPFGLQLPVILPQRRPKGRARGFIRAYAPVLMDCGIDQPMFIDFLETFNTATEASPWINMINFAGIAGSFVAHPFALLIQVAIYISIKTAQEMQGRSR